MGELFWEAHDGKLTSCDRSSNPRTTNMVILGARGDRSARMLLRLGLPDVDFPRATWNGAYFSANATRGEFTPTEKSYSVAGEIAQVSGGRFQIIVTNLETGQVKTKALATYNGPVTESSFPASIQINEIVHTGTFSGVRSNYISLLEVRRPSKMLAPELFTPEQLEELGRKHMSFFSNDVQYGISPHNPARVYRTLSAKEVRAIREAEALRNKRYFTTNTFRVIIVSLFIPPLAFLGWQTLKKRKQQNNNTDT